MRLFTTRRLKDLLFAGRYQQPLVRQLHPVALEILLQPDLPAAPSLLQRLDHRLQQLTHLALVPSEPINGKASDTHQVSNSSGESLLTGVHGRAEIGGHHGLAGEGLVQVKLPQLFPGLVLVDINNYLGFPSIRDKLWS